MVKKSRPHGSFGDLLNVAVVLVLCLIMLYPFWYEIMLSLSDAVLSRQGGAFLVPRGFSLEAYRTVLTSKAVHHAFLNTLYVTLLGTLLSLFTTATTAYPLSRPDLPIRKFFSWMVLIPLIFSGGMIPTYLIVKEMRLLDSLWALIFPALIASYNVVIMRNFFQNLPHELEEAACMDGANDLVIFFRLALPLSAPVLATVGLWLAVGYWNQYLNALLYLNSRSKRVLQQVLTEIINSSRADDVLTMENAAGITPETVKAASIMVTCLPILCVYPFLQRFFVKGVMLGSVKG